MQTIDTAIMAALRKAVESAGSQVELARRAGVLQQHVNKYLSGATKRISLENWAKLEPYLHPYLPQSHRQDPTMAHIRQIERQTYPHTAALFDHVANARRQIYASTAIPMEEKLRLLASLDGVPPEAIPRTTQPEPEEEGIKM